MSWYFVVDHVTVPIRNISKTFIDSKALSDAHSESLININIPSNSKIYTFRSSLLSYLPLKKWEEPKQKVGFCDPKLICIPKKIPTAEIWHFWGFCFLGLVVVAFSYLHIQANLWIFSLFLQQLQMECQLPGSQPSHISEEAGKTSATDIYFKCSMMVTISQKFWKERITILVKKN